MRAALETDRFRSHPRRRDRLTDPYLDFLRQTLQQYPRLRATRRLQMIRSRGYPGSITQLRRVVADLRPPQREAFLRLHTFPGEQGQADWAHFGEVATGVLPRSDAGEFSPRPRPCLRRLGWGRAMVGTARFRYSRLNEAASRPYGI